MMNTKPRLLIFDKSALVRPKSGATRPQAPDDQVLIEGVADRIQAYAIDGWSIAIISNQDAVAAGDQVIDDAIAENQFCLKLLPQAKAIFFCPDDGQTFVDCSEDNFIVRIGCWEGIDRVYGKYRLERGLPNKFFPSEAATVNIFRASGGFRKPRAGMLLSACSLTGINWLDACQRAEAVLYVGCAPEDEAAAADAGIPFQWASQFFGPLHDKDSTIE